MALPPILSGLPVLKLFGHNRPQSNDAKPAKAGADAARDVVELSEAAQAPETVAQAHGIAVDTGAQLAESNVTLGLDPHYAG